DVRLERRFGWHGDILQAASTTAMQTYFSAVSSSSPWREPSRPGPGCCTPPNGIGAAHPDAVEGDHAVFGRRGHARDPVHIVAPGPGGERRCRVSVGAARGGLRDRG